MPYRLADLTTEFINEDSHIMFDPAPNLGEVRFTVSPLRAEDKTPYWLFKQGVAKFQNVKVGDQFIVGEDSRYCDYIEAQYEREHKNK